MHEAQMNDANAFITLTYEDDQLPPGSSLQVSDWQKFAKRVRKQVGPFRFLHCGEYGDQNGRPHYHACIFGLDFTEDKQPWKNELYTSETLTQLWGMGHVVAGPLTFESAAYVARYVMKKITGPMAEKHYEGRKPEYSTMSRRPGIGQTWFEKFCSEVYPSDQVVSRGRIMKPPRYYDKLLEKKDEEQYLHIVKKRKEELPRGPERSYEKLRMKETVLEGRLEMGKRDI